jgi:hypothetical protein
MHSSCQRLPKVLSNSSKLISLFDYKVIRGIDRQVNFRFSLQRRSLGISMDTGKEPFGSQREDALEKAEEVPPARWWRKMASLVLFLDDSVKFTAFCNLLRCCDITRNLLAYF